MTVDFYDKVAKKFGGYAFGTNNPWYTTECPKNNPELSFKEKLLEVASDTKTVLDIGCGDYKFAIYIAKNFKKLIGIELFLFFGKSKQYFIMPKLLAKPASGEYNSASNRICFLKS